MRHVHACGLVAVAAVIGGPHRLAAQRDTSGPRPATRAPLPPVTPAVRAVAGCYRLSARPIGAGTFSRLLGTLRGEQTSVPLPDVVRLDTTAPGRAGVRPGFRVTPDLTDHHDLPFVPGWIPVGRDSLIVNWYDGLYGTFLRLARVGAEWRGEAHYSVDVVPSPVPRAVVTAVRVACAG